MTIITKPITDKKVDKLENPLVVNEELPDGVSITGTWIIYVKNIKKMAVQKIVMNYF